MSDTSDETPDETPAETFAPIEPETVQPVDPNIVVEPDAVEAAPTDDDDE